MAAGLLRSAGPLAEWTPARGSTAGGFSLIAVQLLSVIGLKLTGGLLLLWVCWRLWLELRSDYAEPVIAGAGQAAVAPADGELSTLRPAVVQIDIADLSMSIDNVLAIAGVAREHPVLMVFGLALSVGFMIFAASLIAKLLKGYPWVACLGIVLILYVAVAMIWEGAHEVTGVL